MTVADLLNLASGEDAIAKLVLAAIVFVLWGVGALVSAMKKAAEQARKRRAEAGAPLGSRQPQVIPAVWPPPPPAIGPKPPPLRKAARRPPQQQPVAVAPRAAVAAPPPLAPARAVATAAAARGARPATARPPIRSLIGPSSLQTQIVIAEILGQPVALRDDARL